jgi:methylase of polypeptide subunit release factors
LGHSRRGAKVSTESHDAFVQLLSALEARDYAFVTPTPATHARVIARKRRADTLRDIFGWSLPFTTETLDLELTALLEACGALARRGEDWISTVRVSTLGELMFLHSAFPTLESDAVFFGPDSYRFATLLQTELPRLTRRQHIVDVGAGSGIGAIAAAQAAGAARITLADINPSALILAQANVAHASPRLPPTEWRFVKSNGLAGVDAEIDCIIANPPYIADPAHRLYRDGGGSHGGALSLCWAREAAERLGPDGAFLLYTGSAIVNGEDRLRADLLEALTGFDVSYREIDPDVFGEELEREHYADVERIAAVGLVAIKR